MKTRFIKHIFGAALALGACVSLASCEDFLDTNPNSAVTPEDIFNDVNETKAMLGSIYSKLTDNRLYGLTFPYRFNSNTDVEMRAESSATSRYSNGGDTWCFDVRPSYDELNRTWEKAYEAINYSNDFIENMESAPAFSTEVSAEGPTEWQQMYGEAKCLRAMVYFDLIRTWGDVVFRTKPTEASQSLYTEGLTNRDEIYDYLINDLKSVENMMKYASQLEEGVERASREYCQGLIGQLALYRGGYSLRPGGSVGIMERHADYLDYYDIAREYFNKIITDNRHSLDLESFKDMWVNECNWTVLDNGDVIFEIPMLKDYSGSLGYNIGMVIGYNEDRPAHNFGQGRNSCNFCGMYPFTFDARDLRLDITCVPYSYDENLDQTVAVGKSCVTGWNVGKWSKMYMKSRMDGYGDNTGINSIRLRYADVLLMFAEVENEIAGPTSAAREALKKVRRRAFAAADHAEMVDNYVDALGTKDAFFKAIMDERSWEFGGEGVRKYDLARWNKYGEVLIDTYNKFYTWGYRSFTGGDLGMIRDEIHYREIPDPADPARIILEFGGLKEYGDALGEYPKSQGWEAYAYASNWYFRDEATGEQMVHDEVKWSFRNYVNVNNISSVQPTDPVRYLMPIPSDVITSHRGSIQQSYGY